jgi:transposase
MMGWMAPLRHRRAKLVFLANHQEREPSMSEITTIGLDLAKHVFQVHGIDAEGTTVLRKRLRRGQVLAFFSRIPRCVVGLEACATAHYWACELRALGHEVRLMPAQYVKCTRKAANSPSRTPETRGPPPPRVNRRVLREAVVAGPQRCLAHRMRNLAAKVSEDV